MNRRTQTRNTKDKLAISSPSEYHVQNSRTKTKINSTNEGMNRNIKTLALFAIVFAIIHVAFSGRYVHSDPELQKATKGPHHNVFFENDSAMVKNDTCIITAAPWNHFGLVLHLYDSAITDSSNIECFIWYLGDKSHLSDTAATKKIEKLVASKRHLTMITMEQMAEQFDNFYPDSLGFMFDLPELKLTITPYAFEYTFKIFKPQSVIYIESDVWLTGSLKEVQYKLSHHSVVLIPQMLTPIPEDGKQLNNLDLYKRGVFDSGFMAFSNTDATRNFLKFWQVQRSSYGSMDDDSDMIFNPTQFVPIFFDNFSVLRDYRYNSAYWNLHERGTALHLKDGLPHIFNPSNNKVEKAVYIHFPGIVDNTKNDFSKINSKQNRYSIDDLPRVKEVLLAYVDKVGAQNIPYKKLPYGYSTFDNGLEIEPWMRSYFATAIFPTRADSTTFNAKDETKGKFKFSPYTRLTFQNEVDWKNPFCTRQKCIQNPSKVSFWENLSSSSLEKAVDLTGPYFFSVIEKHVWLSRPDLQTNFNDPIDSDFDNFKKWFVNNVVNEKMLEQKIFQKWLTNWEYHKKHTSKFHKEIETVHDLGVNVFGWHGGLFSIGIVARKMFISAQLSGLPANAIEARMEQTGKKYFLGPSAIDIDFTRSCSEPVTIVVMNADCTPYFTQGIPSTIRSKKYNIGYWNWELEVFPDDFMAYLETFDEIWVPSPFNKKAIESSEQYDGTIVKVVPIPQEVESLDARKTGEDEKNKMLRQSNSDSQTMLEIPLSLRNIQRKGSSKPFVFMVVFDFGSFVERKNPAASIRAFTQAFPLSEDPDGEKYQLIMKSHSGTDLQVDELRKVAGHDPRVVFINDAVSNEENNALHKYQDCHVSLHRSEGYGMNILESMAIGVPVIATQYSGNTDFFDYMPDLIGKCSFPITYKLVELKETHGPYQKGNHWAEADISSAVKAMQTVVKRECQKSGLAKEMIKQVHRHFGLEAIGKKMKHALEDSFPKILKKTGRRVHNREKVHNRVKVHNREKKHKVVDISRGKDMTENDMGISTSQNNK